VKDIASYETSGTISEPYPVTIDMTNYVKTGGKVNIVTVTATFKNGLLTVIVDMYRTTCNYGALYEFKASSTEGESKKLINVTINGKLLLILFFINFLILSLLAHLRYIMVRRSFQPNLTLN